MSSVVAIVVLFSILGLQPAAQGQGASALEGLSARDRRLVEQLAPVYCRLPDGTIWNRQRYLWAVDARGLRGAAAGSAPDRQFARESRSCVGDSWLVAPAWPGAPSVNIASARVECGRTFEVVRIGEGDAVLAAERTDKPILDIWIKSTGETFEFAGLKGPCGMPFASTQCFVFPGAGRTVPVEGVVRQVKGLLLVDKGTRNVELEGEPRTVQVYGVHELDDPSLDVTPAALAEAVKEGRARLGTWVARSGAAEDQRLEMGEGRVDPQGHWEFRELRVVFSQGPANVRSTPGVK
jgi:hypothetical protein